MGELPELGGNLTVVAAISPAVGIVNGRASFGSMNTGKFVEFLGGMLANENYLLLRNSAGSASSINFILND